MKLKDKIAATLALAGCVLAGSTAICGVVLVLGWLAGGFTIGVIAILVACALKTID